MKIKTHTKNRIPDNAKLMVAYATTFGQIPNIKDTPHGTLIADSMNLLVSTYENGELIIETTQNIEWILEALRRFCQLLGGGEINVEGKVEKVEALDDCEEIFSQSYDDFEKFISRPYDDKGFLKETDWTEELVQKNLKILRLIDKWYYSNIDMPNVMKYFLSKTNMENFVLFCLKNGAKDLDDIIANITDYNEDYLTYLARYDAEIFAAMKKGLKCLLSVAELAETAA